LLIIEKWVYISQFIDSQIKEMITQ
jgi:hypothetical protein